MSGKSAGRPAAARSRPRRFISHFAELELQRQPARGRARLTWLLAALVIVAGLALALYDMVSG